ncbi:MAG: hypothetical protein HKL82_06870 [Acidimicrobiaceae bacterium]|nr:hypothetical protein [Acidimicrobiaceae bacterium]
MSQRARSGLYAHPGGGDRGTVDGCRAGLVGELQGGARATHSGFPFLANFDIATKTRL